jgi:hypothetical protein
MKFSFDVHEAGCRPLAPCQNCRIVNFLKPRLTDADLLELDLLLRGGKTEKISLDTLLGDLQFSTRISTCFDKANLKTLGDLVSKTRTQILKIPHLGPVCLEEIEKALLPTGWRIGEVRSPST